MSKTSPFGNGFGAVRLSVGDCFDLGGLILLEEWWSLLGENGVPNMELMVSWLKYAVG